MPIPLKLHFIYLTDRTSGAEGVAYAGRDFHLVHYLAIRSAMACNPACAVFLHGDAAPRGPYWDALRPYVSFCRVEQPREVFGRPVKHVAHRSDVLRLRILLEQGGIYLDLDTICQKPFGALLGHDMAMGRQRSPDGHETGLCNAVIMAAPQADFLKLWYEEYRTFSNDAWAEHSVARPLALAKQHPGLIHVEPPESFFWPSWDAAGIERMLKRDERFEQAYLLHLWGKVSWPLLQDITEDEIMQVDTSYNRLARPYVAALLNQAC